MKKAAIGITKSYNQENARLDIISKIYPKFQDYTSFLYELYTKTGETKYAEKAFENGENTKAIVLDMSISESKLKSDSGIPESLLNEEKNLIISLNALKRNLENKTVAQQKSLLKTITDTEIKLEKLNTNLESNPKYRKAKFSDKSSVKLSEIKKNINADAFIISYVVLKDKILMFGVSKNEFIMRPVSNKNQIDKQLVKLKQDIKSGSNGVLPKEIYKIIIEPFYDVLKNKSELTLITDGELNGLPFEALKDAEGKYLIEKYAIGYLFSAKFLKSKDSKSKDISVMAFAPFNDKLSSFFLPNSEIEIQEIPNVKTYIGKNGSKINFLKNYQNFAVIHLATHAISNIKEPEKSFFRFYDKNSADNKFYMYEFSPGQLKNTSLVFLSACDSYGDSFIGGEGVRGLSRGFYLAGSESIISSLWKAEDFSTSHISRRFYSYLQAGKSYQKALQLAKIDFIKDPQMAQFQSPKYWAPLIFVGHQTQNDIVSFVNFFLIIGIGITVFIILKKIKI
jgi:CHAT domain-containing protein